MQVLRTCWRWNNPTSLAEWQRKENFKSSQAQGLQRKQRRGKINENERKKKKEEE